MLRSTPPTGAAACWIEAAGQGGGAGGAGAAEGLAPRRERRAIAGGGLGRHGHVLAAAGFGVVAGLAGLASQAVAPTPAAASGGAASGARSAADVTPRAAGKGSGDGQVVNVYFGGAVIGAGGARQAARQIAGILNDGARQGDVRLAPNLLPVGT